MNDPICVACVFHDGTQTPPNDLEIVVHKAADLAKFTEDRQKPLLAIWIVVGPAANRGAVIFTGHDTFGLSYVELTDGVYAAQFDNSPKFGDSRVFNRDGTSTARFTAPINFESQVMHGTQVAFQALDFLDPAFDDAQLRAAGVVEPSEGGLSVADVDLCMPSVSEFPDNVIYTDDLELVLDNSLNPISEN